MIIESGVIIFVGLLLLFIKLPRLMMLRLLYKSAWLDFAVSVIAYILHMGTFSGAMAAAVAGLMCSGFTALGKKAVGHVKGRTYTPGWFQLDFPELHLPTENKSRVELRRR